MKNTSLCYIEKDGAYLLLHRVKKVGDVNKDKWIGVGGHFKENESPEECVLREIAEETGLVVEELSYRGIVTFTSDLYEGEYMHLFTAKAQSDCLKTCDEGILEWVDKCQMKALTLWEGDYIFLDLLDKGEPFFSLKLSYYGSELKRAVLNQKVIMEKNHE